MVSKPLERALGHALSSRYTPGDRVGVWVVRWPQRMRGVEEPGLPLRLVAAVSRLCWCGLRLADGVASTGSLSIGQETWQWEVMPFISEVFLYVSLFLFFMVLGIKSRGPCMLN